MAISQPLASLSVAFSTSISSLLVPRQPFSIVIYLLYLLHQLSHPFPAVQKLGFLFPRIWSLVFSLYVLFLKFSDHPVGWWHKSTTLASSFFLWGSSFLLLAVSLHLHVNIQEAVVILQTCGILLVMFLVRATEEGPWLCYLHAYTTSCVCTGIFLCLTTYFKVEFGD